MTKVINDCRAIIVDEAPMTHQLAFEAMDRTLRDITCKDCQMGGIPTLFCGNFRQILPVMPCGTWANIVDTSLRKSYLFITVMCLYTNMRVHLQSNTSTVTLPISFPLVIEHFHLLTILTSSQSQQPLTYKHNHLKS